MIEERLNYIKGTENKLLKPKITTNLSFTLNSTLNYNKN